VSWLQEIQAREENCAVPSTGECAAGGRLSPVQLGQAVRPAEVDARLGSEETQLRGGGGGRGGGRERGGTQSTRAV
jgi:hypothetical protein